MANPDAIFMHCLPSFHDTNTTIGAEIAEQVRRDRDGGRRTRCSAVHAVQGVFDEAENRMHTIKAVMYATLS